MKFYIQVNESGIITDAIEYPHGNYIEVETALLPIGVSGGWFKLIDGAIVEQIDINPNTIATMVQKGQDALMEDLMIRGLLI